MSLDPQQGQPLSDSNASTLTVSQLPSAQHDTRTPGREGLLTTTAIATEQEAHDYNSYLVFRQKLHRPTNCPEEKIPTISISEDEDTVETRRTNIGHTHEENEEREEEEDEATKAAQETHRMPHEFTQTPQKTNPPPSPNNYVKKYIPAHTRRQKGLTRGTNSQ